MQKNQTRERKTTTILTHRKTQSHKMSSKTQREKRVGLRREEWRIISGPALTPSDWANFFVSELLLGQQG